MSVRRGLALALLVCAMAPWQAGAQQIPVPDSYRMSDYRAPVPATVPGGVAVDTASVRALIAEGNVALIDVLPRPPRPAGLSEESIWVPKSHLSLPGALWIPNVGFGVLSDDMRRYFKGHLEKLTSERPGVRLILFCQPDCWMSWNAVKRAADWGYGRLFWYPDGTEGWKAAGFKLEPVEPEPSVE